MRRQFFCLSVTLLLVLSLLAFSSRAQISIAPGSSTRGAELFEKKNCIDCHAFGGVGGKSAPDLAQRSERVRTPIQLASALWNHAPRMWRAQQERQVRPILDAAETADLFAYFYSLLYAKAPGSAANGAHLFEQKGCSACHEINVSTVSSRARKQPFQSPVSTWNSVDDPMAWAERMWNHAGKVLAEQSSAGLSWPQFSAEEMVDLLTYLRSLPEAHSHSATFQAGNPEQGRITFERDCESCHSFGDKTTERKIDLLKRGAPDLLTGYATAMWNHAPQMLARSGERFPVLGPGDMSNLVAYLFAKRYFEEEGNLKRGAEIFQTKNCAVCHEYQRKQTGAPDLSQGTERYSPITISAAVWRHGPAMFKAAQDRKLLWPELKSSEMLDLLTFMNSRLIARIARPD